MDTILEDLSEQALIQASEENILAYWLYTARPPRFEVLDGPDLLRVSSPHPYLIFNGVSRVRFGTDEVEQRIDETMQHFRSRNLPMQWSLGPSTQPADLGTTLAARGLSHSSQTGMAADLRALAAESSAPPGLSIERVADAETLRHWFRPFASSVTWPAEVLSIFYENYTSLGFGDELPVQYFVGLLGDEPVACASLFVGAGVAGLYNVNTIPAAQRRGIGAAITLAALGHARDLGYRAATLHASAQGFNLYRRLGFKAICTIDMYTWPGNAAGA